MGGWADYHSEIHLWNVLVQPHEYCHILFNAPFLKNGISVTKPKWFDEGYANYFNTVYSEAYIEGQKRNFSMFKDYHPTTIQEQNLLDIRLKIYQENNIDINDAENIKDDKEKRILVNNVGALIQAIQNRGTELNTYFMGEGNNLSYDENCSFVNYLIEEYGLEKILYLNVADFSQLTCEKTCEKVFGKSFEELKTDWIDYLKENIKDIELILNFEK